MSILIIIISGFTNFIPALIFGGPVADINLVGFGFSLGAAATLAILQINRDKN